MVGLKMDRTVIDSALLNNRDITEAAYSVLTQWRDSQPNKAIAYTRICEALRNVKMAALINDVEVSEKNVINPPTTMSGDFFRIAQISLFELLTPHEKSKPELYSIHEIYLPWRYFLVHIDGGCNEITAAPVTRKPF